MANHQNKRRAVREKFQKQSSSFFRKKNELSQVAEADIYVAILHNDKLYIYTSTDRPGWPPSQQDIVSHSEMFSI